MKLEKKYKAYYSTIDNCPIAVWNKIGETGNAKYIQIADNYDAIEETYKHKLIVGQIHHEFYQYFGLSDELKDHLELRKRIAIMEFDIEMGATGVIKTRLAQLLIQLEQRRNSKALRFSQQVILLSQHFKFHLDVNKLSIKEYNEYLNTFIEQQQQIKKSLSNGKDKI